MKMTIVAGAPLIGVAVIAFVGYRWLQWRTVHGWQPVRGRVLDARLKVGKELNHGFDFHTPIVEYQYAYRDREFTGHRITVHDRHLSSIFIKEAQGVLDRIGQHPDVYVNPSNPCKAMLVNTLERAHFDYLLTRLVIGALLILLGVAALVYMPAV